MDHHYHCEFERMDRLCFIGINYYFDNEPQLSWYSSCNHISKAQITKESALVNHRLASLIGSERIFSLNLFTILVMKIIIVVCSAVASLTLSGKASYRF